jgi:hypothetical protein
VKFQHVLTFKSRSKLVKIGQMQGLKIQSLFLEISHFWRFSIKYKMGVKFGGNWRLLIFWAILVS